MITTSRAIDTLSPVISANGLFMLVLGTTALLIGVVCNLLGQENSIPFIASGLIINAIGGLIYYLSSESLKREMSMRQILFTIISFWITCSLTATLPIIIGVPFLAPAPAFFETVSALTTTGATVMSGLDDMPRSVLVWRSILHWYGGMGVVVGAMAMFPAMRIGGMHFFLRQGSESEDKLLPTAKQLGFAVLRTYTLLTIICAIAYMLAGIPIFDAVNLAMSTLCTGGMAVKDSGFMTYSDASKLVATVFMLAAGIPLVVHIQFTSGQIKAYWRDSQVRVYIGIFLFLAGLITLYKITNGHPAPYEAFADVMFNTASILTGTGFSDGDFQLWGSFPVAVLFVAMFIGSCTGSTGGAIKIFRLQIIFEVVRVKIKSIIYPHGVFQAKYAGEKIDVSVTESITAFILIYIASFAILAGAFSVTGLTFIESISASASSLGNVGPSLGENIGPVGSYAGFSTIQLGLFIFGMILGRLELMVFFVLFLPRFWRH